MAGEGAASMQAFAMPIAWAKSIPAVRKRHIARRTRKLLKITNPPRQ
jgi:hypothetical protein